MTVWQYRKGKWRYEFQHQGNPEGKAGFRTMREAKAAEAAKKAELRNPAPQTPTGMAFLDASNEYLDLIQRQYVEKVYKEKAFVYASFIAKAGNLPLNLITNMVIESYLKTRPTNANWNKHRKNLSAFFTWAHKKRRLIDHNPCEFVDQLGTEKSIKEIYTQEEFLKLVMSAGKHRPFILTVFLTLARVDEINRLKWEDVNFSERRVVLWTRKTGGRGWKANKLPMSDELYEVLKPLWDKRQSDNAYVFVNPRTGDRVHDRRKTLAFACARAGIRNLGYHAIRHLAASLLNDREKESTATIQRLLGHARVSTTENYLQKVDDNLRGAISKLGHFLEIPAQSPAQEIK